MRPFLLITSLFMLIWGAVACSNEEINEEPIPGKEDAELVENNNEATDQEQLAIVEEFALQIAYLLKKEDMVELAKYVHPQKGVRFTPYGYVDVEEDLVFSATEVKQLMEDATIYEWGTFDGKGTPIEMTYSEYHSRFVYDEDYVNAKHISVNERLGQGNSLDNSKEVYPEGTMVEFHFEGFDPEFEGMDWRSLRLVFEEGENSWLLIGVIHDEWTI